MTEILLEGLEFYAHHGFYKEEQQLGNRFQVDIRISAQLDSASESDNLSQTIDYVEVYKLIQIQMGHKFKLLETLASRIIQDIRTKFPTVSNIECTVSKFNPPISGLCRRVAVSQTWTK
jgi:dihydroneopterin aldolase